MHAAPTASLHLLDQYSRIPSFHGQAPFYFYFAAAREHGSGAVFSVGSESDSLITSVIGIVNISARSSLLLCLSCMVKSSGGR
jgi:hypothetical protein